MDVMVTAGMDAYCSNQRKILEIDDMTLLPPPLLPHHLVFPLSTFHRTKLIRNHSSYKPQANVNFGSSFIIAAVKARFPTDGPNLGITTSGIKVILRRGPPLAPLASYQMLVLAPQSPYQLSVVVRPWSRHGKLEPQNLVSDVLSRSVCDQQSLHPPNVSSAPTISRSVEIDSARSWAPIELHA